MLKLIMNRLGGFIAASFFISFLLTIFFINGCSVYTVKNEFINQTNTIHDLILTSFDNDFTLSISYFSNHTSNLEIDYIASGAQDILYSMLKPIESEKILYTFDERIIDLPESIKRLLMVTNSYYSNYISNFTGDVTQYTYLIQTNQNTNIDIITNDLSLSNLKKNFTNFGYQTNYSKIITSNIIDSQIVSTNYSIITIPQYKQLISIIYPDITNFISFLKPTVKRYNSVFLTNTDEPLTNKFSAFISGYYEMKPRLYGPKDIHLVMNIIKILQTNTNTLDLSLDSREDDLSEKMYTLQKQIRQFLHNRPTGDLFIQTIPDEASVYLDGSYIGKSPLNYPAVPVGSHVLTFQKDNFSPSSANFIVLANLTNQVLKTITKLQTGGIVTINSLPTNSQVFIDSLFKGTTPLIISNLTVGPEHRLKIFNPLTNLKPYYQNFILQTTNTEVNISAQLPERVGQPPVVKNISWWMVYAGWGSVLSATALNIYSHYELSLNLDLYYATLDNNFRTRANYYAAINTTSFTAILLCGAGSMWLTQNALSQEDIFLGFRTKPDGIETTLSLAF